MKRLRLHTRPGTESVVKQIVTGVPAVMTDTRLDHAIALLQRCLVSIATSVVAAAVSVEAR